jgi:hypothetical protein
MSNNPQQSQEAAYDRPLYEYTSIGHGQPPYGGMPPMPPYPPEPPRKSHRRLWITLGIVGIVLVLFVCGGCVATSVFGFRYIQQHIGPVLAADQYYEALKEQKYDMAYSYVDANATIQNQPVSQETFTHLAQTADTTSGKVTQYTNGDFMQTGNSATVMMQITRNKQTYPVRLQLRREGNDWRISNADRI